MLYMLPLYKEKFNQCTDILFYEIFSGYCLNSFYDNMRWFCKLRKF